MASKSKSNLIQSRPEPPDLEDVKSDLERAANNDVAFTFFSSSHSDSSEKATTRRRKTSGRSQTSKEGSQSDIDTCYTKVIKFLELNEALKQSQGSLADQCSELQELGEAVKEQVKSLRTQMT